MFWWWGEFLLEVEQVSIGYALTQVVTLDWTLYEYRCVGWYYSGS